MSDLAGTLFKRMTPEEAFGRYVSSLRGGYSQTDKEIFAAVSQGRLAASALYDSAYRSYIEAADDPILAVAKLNSAQIFSRTMGIDFNTVLRDYDSIAEAWYGKHQGPMTNLESLGNAWEQGIRSMELGELWARVRDGRATEEDHLQLKELESQPIPVDLIRRSIPITILKAAVQSIPYSATGAIAGTAGGLAARGIASLVLPEASAAIATIAMIGRTVASIAALYNSMGGLEYREMIQRGINPNMAASASRWSGLLQALVESDQIMGLLPGNAARKSLIGALQNVIGEGLLKGMWRNPLITFALRQGTRALGEGLEEAVQQAISSIVIETVRQASNAAGTNVPADTWEKVKKEIIDNFVMGAMASLPLGALGEPFSIVEDVGRYNEWKATEYLKKVSEKLTAEEAKAPAAGPAGEMPKTEKPLVWKSYSSEAPDEDGTMHSQIRGAPDAKAKTATVQADYSWNPNTSSVTIEKIVTSKVVDKDNPTESQAQRAAVVQKLRDQFPDASIVWEPTSRVDKALKAQFEALNPKFFSTEYAASKEQATAAGRRGVFVEKLVKIAGLDQAVSEDVAVILDARAKKLGLSTEDFLAKYFTDDMIKAGFSQRGEARVAKGDIDPYGQTAFYVNGVEVPGVDVTRLAEQAKATLHFAKKGNVSGVIHELVGHGFINTLTNDEKVLFEKYLGKKAVEWGKDEHERIATDLEKYFETGKAPTKDLQSVFERLAEFVRQVIEAWIHNKQLSPDAVAAFDALFAQTDETEAEATTTKKPKVHITGKEGRKLRKAAARATEQANKAKEAESRESPVEREKRKHPQTLLFKIEGYHGTRHEIQGKISKSKVGTGEGGSSFGWGVLYATERSELGKQVGKAYADLLAEQEFEVEGKTLESHHGIDNLIHSIGYMKYVLHKDVDALVEYMKERHNFKDAVRVREIYDKVRRIKNRRLYEIEIEDPRGERFLDLDKPVPKNQINLVLQEAGLTLQQVMESTASDTKPMIPWLKRYLMGGLRLKHPVGGMLFDPMAGFALYQALSNALGSKQEASEFLDRAGFTGNTYIGDRAKSDNKGVRDYVIFNEDYLKEPTLAELFGGARNTETPEFKAWFGDSKVVDADGKPMRMYHSTHHGGFGAFKRGELGMHFGTLKQAEDIAEQREYEKVSMYPVYLRAEHPLRLEDRFGWDPPYVINQLKRMNEFDDVTEYEWRTARDDLLFPAEDILITIMKNHGYDSILYYNRVEGINTAGTEGLYKYTDGELEAKFGPNYSWMVFDPNQIKSVFNRGTWSQADDRMLFGGATSSKEDQHLFKVSTKKEEIGGYNTETDQDGNITVLGDPEEIRSLMPSGFKGTISGDSITFSSSVRPRVVAALSGVDYYYSRRGVVTKDAQYESGDREGQLIGAPEQFNTPETLKVLRKRLLAMANEGRLARFWYEQSGKAVLAMVGGDVSEARKLVGLLAIMSAHTTVEANTTAVTKAWAQYKLGLPIRVAMESQDKMANAFLYEGKAWGGEKTNNFYINLLRAVDPAYANRQGVTSDVWMLRGFLYTGKETPTTAQYRFIENQVNWVAQKLGVEPQQAQAMIWTSAKARGKGNQLTAPTAKALEKAKLDYSHLFLRHLGQISWEPRPGRSTGVLEGINNAPYEVQALFLEEALQILHDKDGNDILARELGLLKLGGLIGPGVWQSEISAGRQELLAMAKNDKGEISPEQTKLIQAYATLIGILFRQEMVGWHRAFYDGLKGKENALAVDVGRPLSPEEARSLWTSLNDVMQTAGFPDWESDAAMITSPVGMKIVSFGLTDNKTATTLFMKAVEGWQADIERKTAAFHTEGGIVENKWKEAPNGENYTSWLRAAGFSDILRRVSGLLSPQIQALFERYADYGYGEAGRVPGLIETRADHLLEVDLFGGASSDEAFARGFRTYEEFASAYNATHTVTPGVASDEREAYLRKAWLATHPKAPTGPIVSAGEANTKFLTTLEEDGYQGLQDFLGALGSLLKGPRLRPKGGDIVEAAAWQVASGKPPSPSALRTIFAMIKAAPLKYREQFARITEDPGMRAQLEAERAGEAPEPDVNLAPIRSGILLRNALSRLRAAAAELDDEDLRELYTDGMVAYGQAREEAKAAKEEITQLENELSMAGEALKGWRERFTPGERRISEKNAELRALRRDLTKAQAALRFSKGEDAQARVGDLEAKIVGLRAEIKSRVAGLPTGATIKDTAYAAAREAAKEMKEKIESKYKELTAKRAARDTAIALAKKILAPVAKATDWRVMQQIRAIQRTIDPHFRKNLLTRSMAYLRKIFLETPDLQKILSPDIIERLEARPLNLWTIAELQELNEKVDSLRQLGKLKLAERLAVKRQARLDRQRMLLKRLKESGKYKAPAYRGTIEFEEEKNKENNLLVKWDHSLTTMSRIMRALDNGQENGWWYTTFVARERDAYRTESDNFHRRWGAVEKKMEDLKIKPEDLYSQTVSLGDKTISKWAAIGIYIGLQDPDTAAKIVYGNMLHEDQRKSNTREDLEALGTENLALAMDAAQSLTAAERELADFLIADGSTEFSRLSEACYQYENREPPQVAVYFPNEVMGRSGEEKLVEQMREDLLGRTPRLGRGVQKGMTLPRVRIAPENQLPINLDAFAVYRRGIERQEHYISYAEYVNEMKKIINRGQNADQLRFMVRQTHGQGTLDYIDSWLDEVANPKAYEDYQRMLDGFQQVFRILRGPLGIAYLGLRTSNAVKQLITSPIPYFAYAGGYMVPAMVRNLNIAEYLKQVEIVKKKSPFIRDRVMDVSVKMIKEYGESAGIPKYMKLLARYSLVMIEAADMWSVVSGWTAVYEKALADLQKQGGIDAAEMESRAVREADRITIESQPTGRRADVAPAFKSNNEMQKFLLQFQSPLNVVYNQLFHDVPMDIAEGRLGRAAAIIAGYLATGAILGLLAAPRKDDDDDDELMTLKYTISGALSQPFEAIPLAGSYAADLMEYFITGDRRFRSSQEIFPALQKAFEGARGALTAQDEEAMWNNIWKFAEGTGMISGLPTSALKEYYRVFFERDIAALIGRPEARDK